VNRLLLHDDAKDDLATIRATNPQVADFFLALFAEIESDPKLLDALTIHGYGNRPGDEFDVKKWLKHWKAGRDLWRIKAPSLEILKLRYRVIYCYFPDSRSYHVLAIAERDAIDYDNENPLNTRILTAYGSL
jgi:hypothetical protein